VKENEKEQWREEQCQKKKLSHEEEDSEWRKKRK